VPWTDRPAAVAALVRAATDFTEAGSEIYWCAGAGVIGTSAEDLDAEVEVLRQFLAAWEPREGRHSFFLASSAGGVYAGCSGAPFDEVTTPAPLAPYGHAKLRSEALVLDFAARHGVPLLIGRLANLYGPGQDLSKPQGLISQLCRSHLTRQPLSIYVSLDTMRDYLYVGDAAAMAVCCLGAVSARGGGNVKILASERSTTIGAILGDLHRITRRRPQVVLGTSADARFQVRDLRLRSVVGPPTGSLVRTPLMAGMSATMADVGHQLRVSPGLSHRAPWRAS
jgi:UDP-glucose 4-epimerase